jgi:SAM-dependent MidA family methyltransferase
MTEALYGPGGFFRRQEGPAGHFRTSAHASPLFALAIARLAEENGLATVVDLGAGRGELLEALRIAAPDLQLMGVEIAGRPAGLHNSIAWHEKLPEARDALLVANEWLDNVPVDVVELTDDGPRLVLVDDFGNETIGPPPDPEDAAWLECWWRLDGIGDRAEIGRSRDAAWEEVISHLAHSIAIAIDYGHTRSSRPQFGTLTGYRSGRQVTPVPDGTCDITAHVALDSIGGGFHMTQREALRRLGVDGSRPPVDLAHSDPRAYLAALQRTSEAAELIDSAGLGAFTWLIQPVDMEFRMGDSTA